MLVRMDKNEPMQGAEVVAGRHARPRGQSRAALLNAASALMRARDTIDISMIDIAKSAGVNHAMVKYHFGSKEGLLVALLERDMGSAIADLDRLLRLPLDPERKMRLHLRGIVDTYMRIPYLNRLIQALMRDSEPDQQRRIAKEMLSRIAGAPETILSDGISAGLFCEVNPKLFYFTTIGAADGLYSNRFTLETVFGGIAYPDEAMHAHNRAQTVELLMRGLMP